MKRTFGLITLLLALSACEQPVVNTSDTNETISSPTTFHPRAIETHPDGRCYAHTVPDTTTSIVTGQILVAPEERDASGRVISPAIYRNITRPRTVVTQTGDQFETLCAAAYTREFVASLQRALTVRGTYQGPITGRLTAATNDAIGKFQSTKGRDSDILDLALARQLGLVAAARSE